jgi:hypothetical protein
MKSLRRFFQRLVNSATRRAQDERLREEIQEQGGRIVARNSGEPVAGFHCVSGHSPRSAGIGWCRLGYVVAGAAGHVDSSATRAVDRSHDIATRGVNWLYAKA